MADPKQSQYIIKTFFLIKIHNFVLFMLLLLTFTGFCFFFKRSANFVIFINNNNNWLISVKSMEINQLAWFMVVFKLVKFFEIFKYFFVQTLMTSYITWETQSSTWRVMTPSIFHKKRHINKLVNVNNYVPTLEIRAKFKEICIK